MLLVCSLRCARKTHYSRVRKACWAGGRTRPGSRHTAVVPSQATVTSASSQKNQLLVIMRQPSAFCLFCERSSLFPCCLYFEQSSPQRCLLALRCAQFRRGRPWTRKNDQVIIDFFFFLRVGTTLRTVSHATEEDFKKKKLPLPGVLSRGPESQYMHRIIRKHARFRTYTHSC